MEKYIKIFVLVDDFCKIFQEALKKQLIEKGKRRDRGGKLSLSEQISIMIFYHLSPYKNLKTYYEHFIEKGDLFMQVPCYDRFIQIMPKIFLAMAIMLHYLSGKKTGVYIADSTHISVCKNVRISRHKTFEGLAKRGKTTMGWFYGFKLHMIINDRGEIIAVRITPGNTDDRAALEEMLNKTTLKGKCFADKGYISKGLFAKFYKKGLQIITGIKRNMKNYLMPILDKLFLRKRYVIESIFGILKENFNLHPAKHRSPTNFFVSLLAALLAYQIKPTKPTISYP